MVEVENGTMVSAYNTKSFVFLREQSVGDPAEDVINTVNIPLWVSHELNVSKKYRETDIQVGESVLCNSHDFLLHFVFSVRPLWSPCHPAFFNISSPLCSTSGIQAVMSKVSGFFATSMASMSIRATKSTVFTNRTVDEMLWGYKDPLLERLSKMSHVEDVFGLMYKACTALFIYSL